MPPGKSLGVAFPTRGHYSHQRWCNVARPPLCTLSGIPATNVGGCYYDRDSVVAVAIAVADVVVVVVVLVVVVVVVVVAVIFMVFLPMEHCKLCVEISGP